MKPTKLPTLFFSLSLAASSAHAAVIFTDTFDSGTGAWYKASTTGSLSNSSNRLSWAESGSNMAEAIGRSFDSQTLAVGQSIRLTFDFTWNNSISNTTGNIFRVGLFDVTNAIAANNWSDSNAIGAWAGYYTFVRDGSGSGNIARRENAGSASATVGPTNGGGTATEIGSNTTNYNLNDNATVNYQGMFEVTRISATQTTTLFTLADSTATRFSVTGSQTSGSLVNTFDSVVFKTGANNPTSYFDNVQLEIPDFVWNGGGGNPTDGSGTWTTGSTWWNGRAATAWADNNHAVFGSGSGTAGTVTVSGTVKPASMKFATTGSGNYTITGGTLDFGAAVRTVDTAVDATIDSTISNGGLLKEGSAKLTLTGTNNYTGATTVNAGTLAIDGSTAGGTVTVKSGAFLGGGGTVGGATTIEAGGHLAVGNSTGTQTFSSTLTFESGSIFDWELDAAPTDPGADTSNSGSYDKVIANGDVSGSSVFTIALGTNAFNHAFWDTNKSWTDIFSGSGSFDLSSIFTSFGGSGVASNGLVAGEGQFSFTSNTLNWTAVPEPTSALAGLLITAGLLRRRRA